jgi:hypothetical protein
MAGRKVREMDGDSAAERMTATIARGTGNHYPLRALPLDQVKLIDHGCGVVAARCGEPK